MSTTGNSQRMARGRLVACLLTAVACASVALGSPPGMALDPALPVSHYVHDTWGTNEGLPPGVVRSLVQTVDGYLWCATDDGLARFDGLEFEHFDRDSSPAIVHSNVWSLLAARDGSLWVGTLAGITVLREGKARSFHRKEGYPAEVTAMVQRRDGTIWIASSSGVWSWHGDAFRRYGVEDGLPSPVVNALAEDERGTLWSGTAGGLARFDGRRFVAVSDPTLPTQPVSAIVPDGGRLWVGTKGGGVALLAGALSRRFTERDGLGGDYVLSIHRSSRGAIWVGSSGAPITRIAGERVETFGDREAQVWAFAEDREGNLWFGGPGLHRLKTPKVRTYTTADGLSSDTILAILQDRSGSTWVGTAGGGLNRHRDGRFERFGAGEGLPGPVVVALYEARDGTLWISTNRGLARYADGRITPFTRLQGAPSGPVLAFLEDADGTMWFATNGGGVWSERDGRLRRLTTADGLPSDVVYALYRDSRGTLWFGSTAGLARLDGDRCCVVTPELAGETAVGIEEDADGDLWISTWGAGLVLMRNGAVYAFRERDGLHDDAIHRPIQDLQGTIWMPSNHGIASLPKSAFLDFARGKSKRLRPTVFGRSEGMRNPECNGGVDPAGTRLADGRIWIPTMGGIVEIQPSRIVANPVPPLVHVESVLLDGEPVAFRSGIRTKAARRRLAIRYNALSLYAPEALRFRYRLEGYDDTWRDAGNRRTVEYTNLPAGEFRFVVTASNGDGLESTRPAAFAVVVVPRFVETPAFYLMMVTALALLGFGAHRARTRVLRRRERHLLALVEAKTRAEESIRNSERHFRSLIENASDIILVLDKEGVVHYASPSVERVLGYAPSDLEGKSILPLVHEEDSGETVRTLLGQESSARTVSFRMLRADGSWCALEATGSRVAEGERPAIVVNCRDVTERKLLEAQLERVSRMSSLGRLAATIAHEFNNVLMGIQPFAERMRHEARARGVQTAGAENILRAVQRGKRVTEEILRFTRDAEPVTQALRATDWIAALRTEVPALLGPSVAVRFQLPDPALAVRVDVAQLNQVIANLVLNAQDAMPSGGTIGIELRACRSDGRYAFGVIEQPERFVHLTVRDSGQGIPAGVRPHIFEPLFTTKRIGGTGLGLAVAHQVVLRHGGQIFVESEPGRGTAFHLFLPRAGEDELQTPPETAPEPGLSKLRRVLLVEDDALVATGIAMSLESEGIEVMAVDRGGEAFAAVERFSPDAVVLDLRLPDMDGVDVYRQIASRWPSMAVVFSTGHGDETSLEEILTNPHVGFLLKPYDVATLVRELNARMA